MDKTMTIYFNKRTGDVIQYTGSKNDMSMYGDLEEDYSLIYDYIHVDLDMYVANNFDKFKVVDGELKYTMDNVPSKYL